MGTKLAKKKKTNGVCTTPEKTNKPYGAHEVRKSLKVNNEATAFLHTSFCCCCCSKWPMKLSK